MNDIEFLDAVEGELRAAVAGDVRLIAAKDQRNLFQVWLRAAVSGGL